MIRDIFLLINCVFITNLNLASDVSDVSNIVRGNQRIALSDYVKKHSRRYSDVLKYRQNKTKSFDSLQELMQRQSDDWDADWEKLIETAEGDSLLNSRDYFGDEDEQEDRRGSCDTFFANDNLGSQSIVYGELRKSIEVLNRAGSDSSLKKQEDKVVPQKDKAVLLDDCFNC